MGMGRRATPAADLPHRSPSPATLPAPIPAHRRRSQTHRSTVGFALPTRRRCTAGATGLRAADRRTTRPRTRLHPRDPRARILAQGPARQARLRTHGPSRRGSPHSGRPHHRDPLTRSTHAPSPHRRASRFPVHPPRKTALAERSPARTEPGRRHSRPGTHHTASTPTHLRHRPDQRRSVTASVDGPARTRLHPNEPALRTPVRHTVRTEYERALDLAKSHIGPTARHRTAAADHRCHRRPTGRTHRPSNPGSPAATAYAHPRKVPAPTPTSASTAPAFTPTPPTSQSSPPNASTPKTWPPTPKQRGWIDEADRHRKLIARLDALIAQSEPA